MDDAEYAYSIGVWFCRVIVSEQIATPEQEAHPHGDSRLEARRDKVAIVIPR